MTKKNFIINVLVALGATLILVYFYPHPEVNRYKFEEGRPWNYAKLIAPFDIPIRPDSATVGRVRDSLNHTFAPVFSRNLNVCDQVITDLMSTWASDNAGQSPSDFDTSMRAKTIAYLRNAYMSDIIDDEYGERIDEGTLSSVRMLSSNVVSKRPVKGITYPKKVLREMARSFGKDSVSARGWLEDNVAPQTLRPNLVYEQEASDRLYQEDLNQLNARMGAVISGVIQQGQTIIDKGAVITPQDYTNLITYERMIEEQLSAGDRSKLMMWLGQLLYTLLIIGGLMVFLYFSSSDVWRRPSAMLFIFLTITIFFVIGVLLNENIDSGIYLVPFAIVPILLIVFFDGPTAIFVSVSLILLCAGAVTYPLELMLLETVATVAAAYSLNELSKRSQLLRTSLFVMTSYVMGYLAIELMMNGSLAGFSWRMVIFLAVSSVLASIAYILMVAIERLFGFVSIVTLIELTDTNNPILRELSQECPGTFQHSMAVSNLATDAAIKIKANEQLVRAGALYHDIGKLNNPNFFTENQHGVNPHDALAPEQSARVIIGHVADGLARADKEGLPAVIKDFISQHHGRGKAKYFYYKYCSAHPDQEIDPKPFTYPGPNPQTREASLLMMADAVEAASRSLPQHTPEAIRQLVDKIIDGQLTDGLHHDSTLRFRDVAVIKDAFVHRLMTMYHSRIVYPDAPKINLAPSSK